MVISMKKPKKASPGRFIAWFTFQGSGPDSLRGVGQGVKEKGWKQFVADRVDPLEPLLAPGDAICLHCPFGCTPGVATMEADAAIKAAHDGHQYLLEGFQTAWRPVTDRREVICYLGSLNGTREFQELLVKGYKGSYLSRLAQSYSMVLNAGITIAFDAMCEIGENDPAVRFMRLVASLAGRAYVEPCPAKSDTHLGDVPFIVMESDWRAWTKHSQWPDWALPEKQLTNERIRFMNAPETLGMTWSNSSDWLPQWVASCWKGGWTPAVGADWFVENNIPVRKATEKYL